MGSKMNCAIREPLLSLPVTLKISFESREENGPITFCFPHEHLLDGYITSKFWKFSNKNGILKDMDEGT